MTYPTEYSQGSTHPRTGPRPNPASTGRRLKRNVRIGGRRTTIVLEAYVWDCIDSMLAREAVSLDDFCQWVDRVRSQSSMASAARLVVLTYYRLLEQINQPPFIDEDVKRLQRANMLRAPIPAEPPVPMLNLAIRRFAQDEAHAE